MFMVRTSQKRTFRKSGAYIESKLSETVYGEVIGRFSKKSLETLFKEVKGREERMNAITYAVKNNQTLEEIVKKLKEERTKLL